MKRRGNSARKPPEVFHRASRPSHEGSGLLSLGGRTIPLQATTAQINDCLERG